jgi:hypothetical protein
VLSEKADSAGYHRRCCAELFLRQPLTQDVISLKVGTPRSWHVDKTFAAEYTQSYTFRIFPSTCEPYAPLNYLEKTLAQLAVPERCLFTLAVEIIRERLKRLKEALQ